MKNLLTTLPLIALTFLILTTYMYTTSRLNPTMHKLNPPFSFYSGSDLIFLSETGKDTDTTRIDGYIMGAVDNSADVLWCHNFILTYDNVNKTVSEYIYEHPTLWHLSAIYLINNAMSKKYPCHDP